MSPWADPWVWMAIVGALVAGWVLGFLQAALFRANDQPEVVGAIRKRCEMCGKWAVLCEHDDLDLCTDCRIALEWKAT